MDVIQILLENQLKPLDNIRSRTYFIVDSSLDEQVLRSALDSLIRQHWRKLAARLVSRTKDGRLEYQLPSTFDNNYELFRWSSRNDARSIGEVASFLHGSYPGEGISLLPPLSSLEDQLNSSHWSCERKDESPNSPLLYFHLTFFADATVVGTNCPHATMDQFGLSNVMKAWLDLVEGKIPPPMAGFDEDVLGYIKPYADYQKRDVARKGMMRVRRTGEYIMVLLGLMSEFLLYHKEVSHTIFFPLPLVESLRAKHSKTLEAKYGESPGLSSADVISAILLKFSRMHDKSKRTVVLQQASTLRNRIPALSGEKAKTYVHNAVFYPAAPISIDASTPVSEIAYHNRQCVKQSDDQHEIEVNVAVIREMVRRGQLIHTCEPFGRSYSVTNWSRAWKGLNFDSAIKIAEEKDRIPSKLLVLGQSMETKTPERFGTILMCRTNEGFYCHYAAAASAVKLVKGYLQKDPLLENFYFFIFW